MKKINVIITGTSGMIGESILDLCLSHEAIEKVLIINRRSTGIRHSKLTEIIHKDMSDISKLKQSLIGYDACFFCIGVSSVGMDEISYTAATYTLTMGFASSLATINSKMSFCYISGFGTDSSEKGRVMWARIKGKTENDLMKLPFKKVYNFRPAALIPYLRIKPTQTYQSVKYFKWLLILLRPVLPMFILKLEDFSNAMINSILIGYPTSILESKDIKKLSELKYI